MNLGCTTTQRSLRLIPRHTCRENASRLRLARVDATATAQVCQLDLILMLRALISPAKAGAGPGLNLEAPASSSSRFSGLAQAASSTLRITPPNTFTILHPSNIPRSRKSTHQQPRLKHVCKGKPSLTCRFKQAVNTSHLDEKCRFDACGPMPGRRAAITLHSPSGALQ